MPRSRTPEPHVPPFRVAVAGVGSFTQRVLLPGLIASPGVAVVGVFGPTISKVQSVASAHGIGGLFDDYARMLGATRPHAVVVATPNDLHAQMTHLAIQQGAHVLCEKPLGVNLTEAEGMVDAARRAGVRTAVNFTYRSTSAFRHLRALVREGRIGRVRHVMLAFHQGIRADPAAPIAFRTLRDRGGGALLDVGTHVADAIRWLVGEVEAVAGATSIAIPARPIAATSGNPLVVSGQEKPPPLSLAPGGGGFPMAKVTADDVASFVIRLRNGATGSVQVSQVTHGRSGYRRVEIAGDAGTATIEEDRDVPAVVRYAPANGRLEAVPTPVGLDVPFERFPADHVGRMMRALRGLPPLAGDDPWPGFDDGLAAQRIVDGVERSAAGAGWVSVTPTR